MRAGLTLLAKNPQGYQEYKNDKDGSILILVPAGEFMMGSPEGEGNADEHPRHKVQLSAYLIGKCEVTWKQYMAFCAATNRSRPEAPGFGIQEEHPVVNVSWVDAKAYCDWAGLFLPSEAQWEYAARGRDERKYPWGNERDAAKANSSESGSGGTTPVGAYAAGASPFGALDMAGNVWEWCADWYGKNYYRGLPGKDLMGPGSGGYRCVLRGGSWDDNDLDLRAAGRGRFGPTDRDNDIGFRPAAASRTR